MPPERDHRAEQLCLFLEGADALCPGCGYSLKGLTSTRCPECNQELELRVGLIERVDREWVIGLVGLACGAGFFSLGTAFIVCLSVYYGDWPPADRIWPLYAAGLAAPVMTVAWIRWRRGLRLRAREARWRLAMGCWAVTAAILVACVAWAVRIF